MSRRVPLTLRVNHLFVTLGLFFGLGFNLFVSPKGEELAGHSMIFTFRFSRHKWWWGQTRTVREHHVTVIEAHPEAVCIQLRAVHISFLLTLVKAKRFWTQGFSGKRRRSVVVDWRVVNPGLVEVIFRVSGDGLLSMAASVVHVTAGDTYLLGKCRIEKYQCWWEPFAIFVM